MDHIITHLSKNVKVHVACFTISKLSTIQYNNPLPPPPPHKRKTLSDRNSDTTCISLISKLSFNMFYIFFRRMVHTELTFLCNNPAPSLMLQVVSSMFFREKNVLIKSYPYKFWLSFYKVPLSDPFGYHLNL